MPTSVHLLFDERMMLHRPTSDSFKPKEEEEDMVAYERPERIQAIYDRLLDLERRLLRPGDGGGGGGGEGSMPLSSVHKPTEYMTKARSGGPVGRRFVPLEAQFCNRRTIELAHSSEHYDRMLRTCGLSKKALRDLEVENDLYYCRDTFMASSLACGGVVRCVDAVTKSREMGSGSTRAIALVRPPGHHATRDEAMGFCYFNNIAVAAKHAIHTGRAERVFIVDWDIHHGNGIQDLTYDDPNIFYLSIHRASFHSSSSSSSGGGGGTGWFYPGTGRHDEVGENAGSGTNLNIVWDRGGVGNTEYAAAFTELVLPLVLNFRPGLILIACGLDAAKGDLLGDAKLSPDMYYIMTKSLIETAGSVIPIVVALEGGYNLEVISTCMEAVALALLDEPWPEEKEEEGVKGDRVREDDGPLGIITMKSGRTKQRNRGDRFGLSRYWKGTAVTLSTGGGKMKRTTRSAVSSMKRSAKALANHGRCLGDMHFMTRVRAREEEEEKEAEEKEYQDSDGGGGGEDCEQIESDTLLVRRYSFPIKKRRVVDEMGAVTALLGYNK